MADTSQSGSCSGDALLPNNPFEALHYHFGMLLGVDDLETEQGFHHGKMRLHNGWLHREGAVWGLAVRGDEAHQELRVTRGLALDPAGHELHLDVDHCLNVPAWFAALPEAERARLRAGVAAGDPFRVEAHVVIRHRACLSRQVPAMLEPCDGSGSDTAYSRVVETVDIRLVPGRAPAPPAAPYHRLRLLFGLDGAAARADGTPEPDDSALVSAREAMLTKPRGERLAEALRLLRLSAAEDSAALAPPKTVEGDEWLQFPGADDAAIVLADVSMLLVPAGDAVEMRRHAVDYTPRPAHVATRTIQELLAAAFFCCNGVAAAPAPVTPRPSSPVDATTPVPAIHVPVGPRAMAEAVPAVFETASVKVTAKRMVLAAAQPLAASSVTPKAFALHVVGPEQAWTAVRIETARYDPGKGTVTLGFREPLTVPDGGAARLVAATGGATPLLAADFAPLAGGDFVYMHKGADMTSSTNAGNQTLVLISGGNGITLIPTGTPLKRLNYFDGQFLRADDLQNEQAYLRRLVALSNQAGGAGVVHGFDLEADGDALTLKPGLAIDPQGRVLLLPQDRTVSITELIERSAEIARTARSRATGRTGEFETCDVLSETPPAAVAERSWYLVTIAHAEALCGEDYVYGKLCEEACTTGTIRPNRLEGVVLRAHPLALETALPTSTAESLTRTHLRSCIASAFYADEARRLGSLIFGAGLRSDAWCRGATPFGGSEVALAVLVHDGTEALFLDQWIARRERIDAQPKRHWEWRMAMRPWDVYLAQILQFQCQLHDAFQRQPVKRDEDDPCNRARTLVGEAVQHFDRLAAYYRETTAQLAGLARETRERVLVSPAELKQLDAFRDRLVAAKDTFAFLPENRLLIRRGIVELPSAGYLPVVPGDTLSVNTQVRRLLGEGVDLRFCLVRPDFVPHALEEAQHMERISLLEGLDHADRKPKVDVLVPDGRIAPGRDETGRYYAMRLHLLPANVLPLVVSVVLARRTAKGDADRQRQVETYAAITERIEKQGGLLAREGETFRYEGVARGERERDGIAFHYAGFTDAFELEPAKRAAVAAAPAPSAAVESERATAEGMPETTATSASGPSGWRDPRASFEALVGDRLAAARRFWVAEKETVRDVSSAVWVSVSLAEDPATLAIGGQTRARGEVTVLIVQPVASREIIHLPQAAAGLFSAASLVLQARFTGDLRAEDIESRTGGGDETVRVTGVLSGDLVFTLTVEDEDQSVTLQVSDPVQITRVLAPHGHTYDIGLDAPTVLGPLVDTLLAERTWTAPDEADVRGNVRFRLPTADDFGAYTKRRASPYLIVGDSGAIDAANAGAESGKVQSRQLFRAWQTLNAAVAEPQHPAHERAIRALRAIGKALGSSRFADVKAALLFPAPKSPPEATFLATRDWVLFHRRRDKVCHTVAPTPEIRTRRYAVYQADVATQKTLDALQKAIVANETAAIRRLEPRFLQIVEFAGGVQSVLSPHAQVRATWRQGVGASAGAIVGGVIASRGLAVAEGKALARERLDALADVLDVEFDVRPKADYLVVERVPDAFGQTDADGVIVLATHAEAAGNCHEVYAVPGTSEMYMIVEEAGVGRLAEALRNAQGIVSLGRVGFSGTVPVAAELSAAASRWPAGFGAPTEARVISSASAPAADTASYLAQSAQILAAVGGSGEPGAAGLKAAAMPACPAATVIAGTMVELTVLLVQGVAKQNSTLVGPGDLRPLPALLRNNVPVRSDFETFVAMLQGNAQRVTLLTQEGPGAEGAEQRLQLALDALANRPGQPAITAVNRSIRRLKTSDWNDVQANYLDSGNFDEVIGFEV